MKAIKTKEGPIYIPDGDTHFAAYGYGLCDYQSGVYDSALKHVVTRVQAIDVGAHVGLFTRRMECDFDQVIAFEPEPNNFECLKANIGEKVEAFRSALGNENRDRGLRNPEPVNSGAWELYAGAGVIVSKLDTLKFHFEYVRPSLIKIDAQGSELAILQGAVETLKKWHPVMIVEVTLHNVIANGIYEFMKGLGYELGPRHNKDQVFI